MPSHYGLGVASIPRAAVRRPISYVVTTVVSLLFMVLTPVALPLLYLADLITGHPRGKRSRVWMLLGATIWFEYFGVFGATAIWLRYLGGRIDPDGWMAANYRLEFWWCRSHMRNLRLFAGVRINLIDDEPLRGHRSIVISRHSSHIDAIVPLTVLEVADRTPCYTLKQDLQWAPAMDLVGHRTRNVWIDRTPRPGSPMIAEIEQLAADMPADGSAVIFPEGTFRTQARHDRAIERLRGTRPDLADRANRLRYVLPPRPAGTLALLRGAPDADIVILANVGTEGRSEIADIIATIDEPHPITVLATRYARADVPEADDEFTEWLVDRWLEMDDWIHDRLAAAVHQPQAADHFAVDS